MKLDIEALAAEFRDQGFVRIEGLFGPSDIAALDTKTREILAGAEGIPGETKVFDVEDSHRAQDPRVRRIKKPHEVDPLYRDMAGLASLVEVLAGIIGPDIRLHHSKINLKSAKFGSPLEWHQDWAFIPHSNMDLAIVALMLDAVDEENGPMLVIPGSHKGGLLDHHGEDGWFAAAIDPDKLNLDAAVPLIGPPGTVSIHHPLLVHGSALNRSARERRLLFYEYAAADAWPLFYGVEWDNYAARMVAGRASPHLRMEAVPVKMPHPVRSGGSIYNNQRDLKRRFFETYSEATNPA